MITVGVVMALVGVGLAVLAFLGGVVAFIFFDADGEVTFGGAMIAYVIAAAIAVMGVVILLAGIVFKYLA